MNENISNIPQDSGANDREALLREMIVRLVTFPGDPRVSNPQVLVGQIPEGLPEEIPLPEQSRVLGTLIRGPENASIVIDANQPPAQVLDFYRQRMKAVGWQELELPMGPRHGGFVHDSRALAFEARATFCRSSRGPSFTVMAFPRATDENTSDVRLELDAEGQCAQQSRMRRMHQPMMHDIIPRLIPPEGARQQGGGGSSGGDNTYSSATLALDKDVAIVALASHYITQLERGGWTRIDTGNSSLFAWSTWTFHDEDNEPWLGSFIIFKLPVQQPQYTLYVHASIDTGENQRSGGWFSSYGLMTSI